MAPTEETVSENSPMLDQKAMTCRGKIDMHKLLCLHDLPFLAAVQQVTSLIYITSLEARAKTFM